MECRSLAKHSGTRRVAEEDVANIAVVIETGIVKVSGRMLEPGHKMVVDMMAAPSVLATDVCDELLCHAPVLGRIQVVRPSDHERFLLA